MGFLYSQLFVTPPIPTTSLTGQTIIITGSNTGLGLTAAEHIARLDPARLILAVRTASKGEAARQRIIESTKIDAARVEVWLLDMSSFSNVLAFADRCAKLDRIDGVSLNAGISTNNFEKFEGYESTLTVNVISTFLLVVTLLPTLRKSAAKWGTIPRLSIVASEVHAWASWEEKNLPAGENILRAMSEEEKVKGKLGGRYMDSKLMEVVVFRHLHGLIQKGDLKDKVIINILNPGLCYSDLDTRESHISKSVVKILRLLLARSQEVGGRPLAAGVVADQSSDGKYMHDGVIDEGALSSFVKSEAGDRAGERVWGELKHIYEQLRVGVTAGL